MTGRDSASKKIFYVGKLRGVFWISLALVFLLASVNPNPANADTYPDKEIMMIVGYGAGGSSDRIVRSMKPYFDKYLGVSLIILNQPGASGAIVWTNLSTAQADGYTVGFTNYPPLIALARFLNARYDPDQFIPVAGCSQDPLILIRHAEDKRWETINDFIEDCRKNPNKYKVSMSGPKTLQTAAANIMKDVYDIQFQVVEAPGGSGEAATMLAGRRVDCNLTNAFGGYSIRDISHCLGVFTKQTVPGLWPEGKSIAKSTGVDMPDLAVVRGFAVSSKMKEKYPDRYEFLVKAFKKAMTDPKYIEDTKKRKEDQVIFWFSPQEMQSNIDDMKITIAKFEKYFK